MNGSQFPYEDIVNLPHHVSRSRPQMPLRDRAAQFAPFAALTGYGEAIDETARWTEERREMDEQELSRLNRRLMEIAARLDEHPQVSITYFVPDGRKPGGEYRTVSGAVKSISSISRTITLMDGWTVSLDEISALEETDSKSGQTGKGNDDND